MKNLLISLLVSALLLACNEKEAPVPTATGTYEGTYSGYVSPTAVAGNCTGDLVEKDSELSGTLVFTPNIFGNPGTVSSFPVSGTLKMLGDTVYGVNGTISIGSGIGTIPLAGSISLDKKTIKMSCSPAPVFNLKWTLTRK